MNIVAWLRRGTGAVVVLTSVLAGCTLYRYDPVREVDVEDLADRGCKDGDRVITRAELNQVYEDALVLWDGRDSETTLTVNFKGPGIARKTKSILGKDRYESAYEALRAVQEDERPIEVTIECRGERKTPIATRFSYRDEGGEEIAFEF